MSDNVNHPPHYTQFPEGLFAECIDYTRHMPFSQGNAFKYLYRAGSKGDPAEDIAKARWYLQDAFEHGQYVNVTAVPGFPRIDPNLTHRSQALFYIARGQTVNAASGIDHFGLRILERRGDR